MVEPTKKIKVKCSHCGYEMLSSSKLAYVTCSSCRRKTKRIDIEETNQPKKKLEGDIHEGKD